MNRIADIVLVVFSLIILVLVTTTLPVAIVLGQEEQNWLTYNSPDVVYSIQFPPDWSEYNEYNYDNRSSVIFGSTEKYGVIGVVRDPVEEYLDTDTLTLKTKTLQDYMKERIAWINSKPDLEFVKNISTTIGQNHYPALQVHYWGEFEDEYNIDTIMVNGGYRYIFNFSAPPLDVPDFFPTVEKVLASFNITSNVTTKINKTANTSSFLFYHNPVFGVSTEYPLGWSAVDMASNQSESYHIVAEFFYPLKNSSDKFREEVAIAIDQSGYYESLSGYLSDLINYYRENSSEFKVVENNTNSTLAGRLAYKLIFDDLSADKDVKIRALEYATMIDNIVYSISFYAEKDKYFEYLPLIQIMVNSFKITDVGLEPIYPTLQNASSQHIGNVALE